MLSFPPTSVREVIARGRADAEAHGGFDATACALAKTNSRVSRLVGDHGVYLMSNGKLPEGAKPLVIYAVGRRSRIHDDWFEVKSAADSPAIMVSIYVNSSKP